MWPQPRFATWVANSGLGKPRGLDLGAAPGLQSRFGYNPGAQPGLQIRCYHNLGLQHGLQAQVCETTWTWPHLDIHIARFFLRKKPWFCRDSTKFLVLCSYSNPPRLYHAKNRGNWACRSKVIIILRSNRRMSLQSTNRPWPSFFLMCRWLRFLWPSPYQ